MRVVLSSIFTFYRFEYDIDAVHEKIRGAQIIIDG